MYCINAVDRTHKASIEHHINVKTKPLGSLGQLEQLAVELALILGKENPNIVQPHQLVFAGDHGISAMGISIAGSEVTGQMVANFCAGGGAINAFCQQANMALTVIDCGTINEQAAHPLLKKQRIAPSTAPLHTHVAMTQQQAQQAIDAGITIAQQYINEGANLIGIGEMGIGNTTAAAALMYALTDYSIDDCVGRGTGVDDETLDRKKKLVQTANAYHQPQLTSPLNTLACLGGFEIAQMVGAMLGTAQLGAVILVDGFISTTAALIATKLAPHTRDYMVFSHGSQELGHQKLLSTLNAKPLLSLELRLGEGSGCPLALPLLQSALAFYNNMASFEQAQVTEVN